MRCRFFQESFNVKLLTLKKKKKNKKNSMTLSTFNLIFFLQMAWYNKQSISYVLYIHTHYGHYNPSVRITTQFHTPLMLRVLILYMSGRELQFKVDSQRQVFEKFFMAILFTLRVFVRNLLRELPRKYFSCFRFHD